MALALRCPWAPAPTSPCPAPWLWGALSSPVSQASSLATVPVSLLCAHLRTAPVSDALRAALMLTEMAPPPLAMPFAELVHGFVRLYTFLCLHPVCYLYVFKARAAGLTQDSCCAGGARVVLPKPVGHPHRTRLRKLPQGPTARRPQIGKEHFCLFLFRTPRRPFPATRAHPCSFLCVFLLVNADVVCCQNLGS